MPILMTYWTTVWCNAVRERQHGYHAHTVDELAAFQRRLSDRRFTMPGPMQYGRASYHIRLRHQPA